MLSNDEILKRLNEVKENISKACEKVNRDNDVKLIAVTKTFPHEIIQMCIDLGVETVGENRPLEIKEKYEIYDKKVKWHMIGHLQRNKVKYIIDKVSLVHSLDNIKLAEELNKRAKTNDIIIECLVQVNIADEDSKSGIHKSEIDSFFKELEIFSNIKVVGFMNMAPFYDDKEKTRPEFREMNEIFKIYKEKKYKNIEIKYLSMGMSNDYEIAIEEGSNMVRVGSSIFGARNYNK